MTSLFQEQSTLLSRGALVTYPLERFLNGFHRQCDGLVLHRYCSRLVIAANLPNPLDPANGHADGHYSTSAGNPWYVQGNAFHNNLLNIANIA